MRSLTDKILVLLLSVFLVSYAFYQGYRYLNTPYKTETAHEYTIADSITGTGVYIRDEIIVNQPSGGTMYYLYPDGTKVTQGMTVAEAFSDEEDVKKRNEIKILEKKVQDLKSLPVGQSNKTANTGLLNKQISTSLTEIKHDADNGIVYNINENTLKLTQQLGKKAVISGRDVDIGTTINMYDSQINSFKNSIGTVQNKYQSPKSGYFVSSFDGLEHELTPANITKLTDKKLIEISENPPTLNSSSVGKIILSHNWNITMPINKDDVHRFTQGSTVRLDFLSAEEYDIPGVISQVINDDNGDNYVIINCNYISPMLVSERRGDIRVKFKSFTGLRINSSSIRFNDLVKGVYILDDHQIKFRSIDVIYESNGFALVNNISTNLNTLKQFDQVLLEGVDLYNGKPIKQ